MANWKCTNCGRTSTIQDDEIPEVCPKCGRSVEIYPVGPAVPKRNPGCLRCRWLHFDDKVMPWLKIPECLHEGNIIETYNPMSGMGREAGNPEVINADGRCPYFEEKEDGDNEADKIQE